MAKHMSLEAMLDEERRDVLALLEGPPAGQARGPASSPAAGRGSSPFTNTQSPVRSMLDIDGDAPPRRSAATNGTTTGSPRQVSVRSMLDVDGALPAPSGPVRSMLNISNTSNATVSSRVAQASPSATNHRAHTSNRSLHSSLSDVASRPTGSGPASRTSTSDLTPEVGLQKPRSNPLDVDPSAYQFSGFLPSNPGGPTVPKRNTQAGKKSSLTSAMAEVVRGGDFSGFGGRNSSVGGAKSRSPHNRLAPRSNSPQPGPADPSKFVLDDGRVIDMNSAYRRLSDANLARSKGTLSTLGSQGNRRRTNSGNASGLASRLEKDYMPIDGEGAVVDSSDEDDSDEDQRRGRKKGTRSTENGGPESQTIGMGRGKGPRTAQSLMAAAEEERQEIANKYGNVRSLIEPQILVTDSSGDKPRPTKPGVHPHTSFDENNSAFNTPVTSDTEREAKDIERAQKLTINMTSISSTPATSRCVRTLYRGDFANMQQEAKDNQRRVRKYLVATDLSDEAAHALEWTIGTVLRDGDTLLAIYCVDEEVGITQNDTSGEDQMREQAAAIAASTKPTGSTPILGPVKAPGTLGPGFRLGSTGSVNESPMGSRSKAEQERHRAVQDITDRVAKLLRKTKLQVKVVIEVIHCKSPKHLITEVIDYISPTLVILGSRGRSALKGVILGSFSNYLVTKSSVPVMVARKRLRKHTKYKRPEVRLANNLSNPAIKSLATAKIELPMR